MLRNHDAKALWQADLDHCIHPWTDFSDWPRTGSTIMVRGEGAHVWNAEGEKFIDGIGGLWFANVGFGRQELIDAATRQLGMLPQYSYFTDIGNPPATELAAKLAELAPGDLNHVFYSTGGSVANDSAVRIAHFYFSALGKPSKRLIISRRYAYHGSTYLAAALSGKASDKTGFQFPEGLVHHVSEANCYRMPDGVDDESSYCDFLVREFERKIAELGAENVACFFAEPIMGAGGVLVAPAGYHRRMKEVCEANDILYVSDEVVTAFGRLGHFFASKDRFDVMPDMIVTAKGITSGYIPLAATLVSDRMFDTIARRPDGALLTHGFTYSGHAVSVRGRHREHRRHGTRRPLRTCSLDWSLFRRAPEDTRRPAHRGRRTGQPLHALRRVGAGPRIEGALWRRHRDREAHRTPRAVAGPHRAAHRQPERTLARAHTVQERDRSNRRDTPRRHQGHDGGARSRGVRLRSVDGPSRPNRSSTSSARRSPAPSFVMQRRHGTPQWPSQRIAL